MIFWGPALPRPIDTGGADRGRGIFILSSWWWKIWKGARFATRVCEKQLVLVAASLSYAFLLWDISIVLTLYTIAVPSLGRPEVHD